MITVKTFPESEFDISEILRYAGSKNAGEDIINLALECVGKVRGMLSYKVCYDILDAPIAIDSTLVRTYLSDCKKVVLFAATVGVEMDRFILKYSRLSPARGLMMQAIGAERIESLCDDFCKYIDFKFGHITKPRISPGYGDFKLENQTYFFDMLDCSKRIGVSLNDSMLMSPSKSVTALIGLK